MKKVLQIISNSFRLAILELRNNKLRTTLSLLGVTFGIFCIIGVLATVNSLEQNVQNDIKSLGSNTIYIDKWDYSGGPDYPWWKYVNRPKPKYEEMRMLHSTSPLIDKIAYVLSANGNVESGNSMLERIQVYGPTEQFVEIQPFEIAHGRYFNALELAQGGSVAVIGNENAELLFGKPENAVGKHIKVRGKSSTIVGVIKKQGKGFLGGGWEFDRSVLFTYPFFRTVFMERGTDPMIMVQGKEGVDIEAFRGELKASMRNIRRLGPKEDDDFSLNAVSDFSKQAAGFFSSVSLGGWFIGILSLIVGAFSIANIMFVTVRERTAIIGLKKAIGAKRNTILIEFLLESSFICLLGGMIGLLMVFGLTFI
jgi:putative ABC transport system permease protein